jgi:hypothetical protein
MLNIITQCVTFSIAVMLRGIFLTVVMLNAVVHNVVAPHRRPEGRKPMSWGLLLNVE